MTLTERTDRLQQLRDELKAAQEAQAMYQANATEAYALAADHRPGTANMAYTKYAVRCKGQAMVWARRVGELLCEIAALEKPACFAPVELSAEQCAAVDDTHNFCAVAA